MPEVAATPVWARSEVAPSTPAGAAPATPEGASAGGTPLSLVANIENPEVDAALRLGNPTAAVRLALADSLAEAVEVCLERAEDWSARVFGVHRWDPEYWRRPEAHAALMMLLAVPPDAPEGAVSVPAHLPAMEPELSSQLGRWLAWLQQRRYRWPVSVRVRFPLADGTLALCAWDPEGSLRLGDGGLRILRSEISVIDARSWTLAAWIARAAWQFRLDIRGVVAAGVVDGSDVLSDSGWRPQGQLPGKRAGAEVWSRWFAGRLRWVVSQHAAWVPPGAREIRTLGEAVDLFGARFASVRRAISGSSAGKRQDRPATWYDGKNDAEALPATRLVRRGRDGVEDLEDHLREGGESSVLVVGPEGSGRSVAMLDLARRNGTLVVLDLDACPDGEEPMAAWLAGEIFSSVADTAARRPTASDAGDGRIPWQLLDHPRVVIVFDHVDHGPTERRAGALRWIGDRLPQRCRRVYVAADPEAARARVEGLTHPPFFAEPRVPASWLALRGVEHHMAQLVFGDAAPGSVAYVSLAVRVARLGRRPVGEGLLDAWALLESRLNAGLTGEGPRTPQGLPVESREISPRRADPVLDELGRLALRQLRTGAGGRLSPLACRSPWVMPGRDGGWRFRHDAWAEIAAARSMLLQGRLLGWMISPALRRACRLAAWELRRRPDDWEWPEQDRGYLLLAAAAAAPDAEAEVLLDALERSARVGTGLRRAAGRVRIARSARVRLSQGDPRGAQAELRSARHGLYAGSACPLERELRVLHARALSRSAEPVQALALLQQEPGFEDLESALRTLHATRDPDAVDAWVRVSVAGALAEALAWGGQLEAAACVLDARAEVQERIGADATGSRLRQALYLVGAGRRGAEGALADADRLFEDEPAECSPWRTVLAARLGRSTGAGPAEGRIGALYAWASWEASGTGEEAAWAALEAAGMSLEAARQALLMGRREEALAGIEVWLGDAEPANEAEIAAGARWGVGPERVTAPARHAQLRALLARGAVVEAASLLPPF